MTYRNLRFAGGIFAAALLAGLVSCTDLEPEAQGILLQESESGELPLPDDPDAAFNSTFRNLGFFASQDRMYALQEMSSDELIGPTRGTDWSDFGKWRQLHAHTWDASNEEFLKTFQVLTSGYFGSTQVIAASTDASLTARAQFLRAFFMSHQVDLFGQVPFRQATEGIGTVLEVMTRTEATDMIISDLEAAIDALPSYDGNGAAVTREAAQALLSRVLLNRAVYTADNAAGPYSFDNADMARVIELSDQIIDNPSLELQEEGTYFDMFGPKATELSTEMIFGLNYASGGDAYDFGPQSFQYHTLHYNNDVGGWNGFTTIADFYNKWDQDDERFSADPPYDSTALRLGFLAGQQFRYDLETGETVPVQDRAGNPLDFTVDVDLFYSNERQGVRVIKYYPDFDERANFQTFDQTGDVPLLRLGEIYLNKAEAQMRSGDNGGAAETLNELLDSRDGADAVGSIDEQVMIDNRGFELYWEGHRRRDLIRFGQFLRPYTEKEYESEPFRVLFPFPQSQVDANANLDQNPGY